MVGTNDCARKEKNPELFEKNLDILTAGIELVHSISILHNTILSSP